MTKKICVVFVSNKNYFGVFKNTCEQLITNGNYKGDICLVIGDDLLNDELLECELIKNNNIFIKHFPNINFDEEFLNIQQNLDRPPHWYQKLFQYHKLHLFNIFFKKWDYIFYLDCGIRIFSDISPILNEAKENTLLAHSDAYPNYENKLDIQFVQNNKYFEKLNNNYNLNIDYFQTTIMLYDTNIIEENTYNDLLNLLLEYPISVSNDQGIIALYFSSIKPFFEQIKINDGDQFYYDYLKRNWSNRYIMVKIDWCIN